MKLWGSIQKPGLWGQKGQISRFSRGGWVCSMFREREFDALHPDPASCSRQLDEDMEMRSKRMQAMNVRVQQITATILSLSLFPPPQQCNTLDILGNTCTSIMALIYHTALIRIETLPNSMLNFGFVFIGTVHAHVTCKQFCLIAMQWCPMMRPYWYD